ncbi:MAG: hypothetical protein Q9227_003086 [Pyrenula ochraceoflavens]
MVKNEKSMDNVQPIAVVGMACRFPGNATSPSRLWDLCASGRDVWSPIPKERLDLDSWYDPDGDRPGRAMDPQLRQILESVYEATEDAGIPLQSLAGSNTAVYTGVFGTDYQGIQLRDNEFTDAAYTTSNMTTMFAGRVSHFYDFQGPSMAIDTGCSSGLVVLHQGCQAIRSGEAELSVVSASNLMLSQDMFVGLSTLGAVGADGRCYAWDDRAHGYGRGEGVAALILKPLTTALRDGDCIHAVIRESGINQDGKTTTVTSPSMGAQIKLIETCYRRAGLDIAETAYVEAHMTGTQIGDATEAEALAKTFGKHHANDPILVGSIKTNIGHTEGVSGLAAIIKTAYAFKHRQIPANLNYKTTNSKIKLDEWHLKVPTHLTPWPQNKLLRASINNFGYGGTNAHVILENAPPMHSYANGVNGFQHNGVHTSERYRVFVLSAKDPAVCQVMAKNLAAHLRQALEEGLEPPLGDLAFTLAERRSRLPWTMAVRASTIEELIDTLEHPTTKPIQSSKRPRLGFVFNGQGAQWYAMGRELITAYPVFGSSIHRAGQILKEYGATWSLYHELMRDEESTRVGETNMTMPITVALQLCLVDLLKSWGIYPSAVTSHSSGEFAAAYSVGALSFKEALGLIYFRAEMAHRHQKETTKAGGMLAAGIGAEVASRYTADRSRGHIVVACINSPDSVTLSGDLHAIESIASQLQSEGLFARKLKVPLAFHSHHMLPMAKEYRSLLPSILPNQRQWDNNAVFTSAVTGGRIAPGMLTVDHWVNNITNPVRFVEAFESMCFSPTADGNSSVSNVDAIVEIGPHSTLAGPIRQILNDRKMPYVSVLKRPVDAVKTAQDLVCDLLACGYPLDLSAVNLPFGPEPQYFTSDLPSYPWNHSSRYWVETRISKEMRNKRFPPHELLGSLLAGATGPATIWRNFLRRSDIPWLVDHQVDSEVVLPGAAYVAMAIEATRLLADPISIIRSFRLRAIDIANALTIPESSREVEVHTSLRPCNESELDHRGWYEFEISSLDASGIWIRNCNGFVISETDDIKKSALFYEQETPHDESFFPTDAKVLDIDVPSVYATMRKMNLNHGPAFQNLLNGRTNGTKSIASLSIPDEASASLDYVVHPITLDTIIQAALSGLPKGTSNGSMFLPRSIGAISVPCDLKRQAGDQLKAFIEVHKSDRRGFASDIDVCNNDDATSSTSVLRIENFFFQSLPLGADANASDTDAPLNGKTRWEIDTSYQIPAAVKDAMRIVLDDTAADLESKTARSAYHFIRDALMQLESEDQEGWAWHHRRLYKWMEQIVALGETGALAPGSKAWSRTSKGIKQMLFDQVEAIEGSYGKLTVRIGKSLAGIVRGQVTPLELMMEGNLLNDYYMEMPVLRDRSYKQLRKLIELYAVKNPGAHVLEIGAGTGGATQTVLEAFGAKGDGSGSLIGHYTFTDVSSGFFEAGKQKLAAWQGMLDFAKLDIESDPVEQSFEAGSYDLIVASMVLHATKDLRKTMSHVRKLLKPGGQAVLVETIQDRLDAQMIFGTLPGWWLGQEPYRNMSPNVPLHIWDDVLKASGFTGVDFDISDCEQKDHVNASVFVTTAAVAPSYNLPVSVVYVKPPPEIWLTRLCDAVQNEVGHQPTVEAIDQLSDVEDKICVFTAEMHDPFVDGLSAESFEKLRNLLVKSRGVLWLSCGSVINAALPSYWQTLGLLRTLRLEHAGNRYVHLDFEHDANRWSEDKIKFIVHALRQSFDSNKEFTEIEWEYAVKDSTLYIPRVYGEKHIADSVDPAPQLRPFLQQGRKVVWEPPKSSLLSDIFFRDEPHLPGDIPSGMVQIAPKAYGLNFRDVMVALGQLDDTLVGHECAGIITGLGSNAEQSGLKVGDRVCALAKGRFASSSLAPWSSVCKLPDDMPWEQGAHISIVYLTAYHSLVEIGRLRKGETVLIHAAAGGVGQAAIAVAQHVGAEVLVTCSTEAKKQLLIDRHNVNPARIWSSRDTTFASAVMATTGGKGVDVVLNSLSGPMLKATWSCIARFGRFVEIGKVDIEAARLMDMSPFGRCASYAGVDLLQLSEYQPLIFNEGLRESVRICYQRSKKGTTSMYPVETYAISDIEKAMRKMQSGTHVGKIILIPNAEDAVKVVSQPEPLSLARSDSTYLIVGGLGGVGRSIAQWMVERGAKNILLVSRNAESSLEVRELIQTARVEGCRLHVRNCDVAMESDFTKLLTYSSEVSLPPIKGVVNCAMVLDDTIMERMTFEQWQHSVKPKVASTINLDKHLPDLSFFLMLSSVVGAIGHVSQSNYAAGNTFQDGMARHRTVCGKPAVSLDLCGVTNVGYVAVTGAAESQNKSDGINRTQARVESLGTTFLKVEDVLTYIEAAVLRAPLATCPEDAQIILGLNPWDRLTNEQPVRRDRRFSTLRLTSSRGATVGGEPAGGPSKTGQAGILSRALLKSQIQDPEAVADAIASRLAVIFNTSADNLDLSVPMAAHGVDSLVAVELRNWLSTTAKAKVSIFEILQSNSLKEFAGLVMERSQVVKAS